MAAQFQISYDRLKTISNISESQSCQVKKAELKADDGSGTTVEVATKAYTNFQTSEIKILAKLQHKNVIKFIGAVIEPDKHILVMEYAPNGSLYDYLRNQSKQLSVDHSLEWAKHCSNAVAYLHNQGIIHRDIKSPNFLLSTDFTEQGAPVRVLKLCDFGISHRVNTSATSTSATIGGLSCRWAAPEVIDDHICCSIKSDVYSLAVVIWELFTVEIPYEGLKDYKIAPEIASGKTPNIESIESQGNVCKILQMCWRGEKGDRPTAKRVVELLDEITGDGPDIEPDHAQPPASLIRVTEQLDSLADKFSSVGLTHGIPEGDFRQLLVDIAEWYDKLGYINMLKMLYKDHIKSNYELQRATNVMDLLRLLIGSGNLSKTNLTILCDTIKATEQFGFKSKIKNEYFQNVRELEISEFTRYRQQLLKLGMVLTQDDVVRLDEIYNMPLLKKYEDNWCLIMDLEHRMKLGEGKMDTFNKVLRSNELSQAVKVFLDESLRPSTPGNSQHLSSQRGDGVEMSLEDFRQLLLDISSWWKRYGNVNMLKVLLRDFKDKISLNQIVEKENPRELLELLRGPGLISPSNIDVLFEAAFLGGLHGVEPTIKKYVPTFPGFDKLIIHRFTEHRQSLIRFGRLISMDKKERIGHLYDLAYGQLADQWVLIFELEESAILTVERKKLFIKKLEDNGMQHEANALK